MLAERTRLFATSGTAQARAAAKAATASGKSIIDLTAGEIITDPPPTVREGAMAAISRGVNRYTDTLGLAELREAIAREVELHTGQVWDAAEIAVTTGAKQALFNAAMTILNPGDEVIIPAPYWTTFPAQVKLAGAAPVYVETRHSGYVPRAEDIEAAITPSTRVIILNTPSNPTGVVYPRETLGDIARLASDYDLWVIFDECYAAFTYAPHAHTHILEAAPGLRPRTLIVNSFSKQLAVTGWRLGYLAGPKPVISAVKALQSHTTSNPNVIAQHAILAHLEAQDGTYVEKIATRLAAARALGLEILAELERVPVPAAQGGFYFYLDLSALVNPEAGVTADEVAARLLAEAGVATVPGTAFGDPAGLRVSYGLPLSMMENGLSCLVEVLNDW